MKLAAIAYGLDAAFSSGYEVASDGDRPMIFPLLLAQAPHVQGWLTSHLLETTLSSSEWVVWLLALLSVFSIALMLERLAFFFSNRFPNAEDLGLPLAKGELAEVRAALAGQNGMEAVVLREALEGVPRGADAVEQIIAAAIARERPRYERSLSFLGTLGNNAPFIGLFGTVLGIIKAFHDLGAANVKGAMVQQTVMAGISEALVATAIGLLVAIPAVVAFNGFSRWLKTITSRTQSLGHALVGQLKSKA